MRRMLAWILAAGMILSLTACGASEPAPQSTAAPETTAATEAPTTEAPATDAPTTEAPATEAPTTEAPATTEPEPTEAPVDGEDWRTWRSYSEDLRIAEAFFVCLSVNDEETGYAVYDAADGERIGTLFAPKTLRNEFFAGEILCEDVNQDTLNEIGIAVGDGEVLWYCYDGVLNGTWPDNPEGAFYRISDEEPGGDPEEYVCFPYEAPEIEEMTPEQQAIYDEVWPLVEAVEDFHYEVEDYGYDFMEDLLTVYGNIVELHPEVEFYFELREINNDEGYLTAMESWYYCRWDPDQNEDRDAVKAGIAAFKEKCTEIVSGLNDGMTAYDKYHYLAKTISQNADYDYEGETTAAASPWAGVMGGKCICQGYSVAMEVLCREANLYCRIVEGVSRDESHAWNLVKLPAGTYHVDITWADGQDEPGVGAWFTYFMLTQEQIELDHEITDGTVATGT